MSKCKPIIFPIIFLVLINISLAIQADGINPNVRFDLGYITFNITSDNEARGYGSWISGILDNLQARLGILDYDVSKPNIILISPDDNELIEQLGVNSKVIDFNYNVTDLSRINECYLKINNTIEEIDTTITRKTIQIISHTFSQSGVYNWTIGCYDFFNYSSEAIVRDLDLNIGGVLDLRGVGTSQGGFDFEKIKIDVPDEWVLGKEEKISVKIYQDGGNLYTPSSLSFFFSEDYFSEINRTIESEGKINVIFYVSASAPLEEYSVRIVAGEGNSEIQENYSFNVVEKKGLKWKIIGGVVVISIIGGIIYYNKSDEELLRVEYES